MFDKLRTWWLMRPRQLKKRLALADLWSHFYSPTFEALFPIEMPAIDRVDQLYTALQVNSDDLSEPLGRDQFSYKRLSGSSVLSGTLHNRYRYTPGSFLRVSHYGDTFHVLILEVKPSPGGSNTIPIKGLVVSREDLDIKTATEEWVNLKRNKKDLPITHISREKELEEILEEEPPGWVGHAVIRPL